MTEERNIHHIQYDHTKSLHDKCKKYMHYHVILKLSDGSTVDGIIEDVKNDGVSVLVGEDGMQREEDEIDDRQYYDVYGRPRRRFRRFIRRFLPLAALTALSLFPYYYPPYPYYYPPFYPYYPYYY